MAKRHNLKAYLKHVGGEGGEDSDENNEELAAFLDNEVDTLAPSLSFLLCLAHNIPSLLTGQGEGRRRGR